MEPRDCEVPSDWELWDTTGPRPNYYQSFPGDAPGRRPGGAPPGAGNPPADYYGGDTGPYRPGSYSTGAHATGSHSTGAHARGTRPDPMTATAPNPWLVQADDRAARA